MKKTLPPHANWLPLPSEGYPMFNMLRESFSQAVGEASMDLEGS